MTPRSLARRSSLGLGLLLVAGCPGPSAPAPAAPVGGLAPVASAPAPVAPVGGLAPVANAPAPAPDAFVTPPPGRVNVRPARNSRATDDQFLGPNWWRIDYEVATPGKGLLQVGLWTREGWTTCGLPAAGASELLVSLGIRRIRGDDVLDRLDPLCARDERARVVEAVLPLRGRSYYEWQVRIYGQRGPYDGRGGGTGGVVPWSPDLPADAWLVSPLRPTGEFSTLPPGRTRLARLAFFDAQGGSIQALANPLGPLGEETEIQPLGGAPAMAEKDWPMPVWNLALQWTDGELLLWEGR